MPRVLMIAYHFPPVAGSSGMQRTLRFAQHLPEFGWEPLVLTIDPRAYERTSSDLMGDIPEGTVVRRAFGLDTARHLSIGGRFFRWMALPDRWVTWRLGAVPEGMRMIEEFRPDVLWSTYPIATAHLIGSILHRKSGLPWVADFRDPMTQERYPTNPWIRRSFTSIEEKTVRNAACSVFTTPGAFDMYRARYPECADRMAVLENGFDEESFSGLGNTSDPLVPGAVVLLHSGIVYPQERDPRALFQALERLKAAGRVNGDKLKIRFRAAEHEDLIRSLRDKHGLGSMIEVCPPLPYREALAEMMRSDALLVLQSAGCNGQIPAKIYEYLRAKRPILCLADPAGNTAGVARGAGLQDIARLESVEEIEQILPGFLERLARGVVATPDEHVIAMSSRRGRTAAFAPILDRARQSR